ncbi:MAG: YdeI/OmpD-associated family protein [Hymenobacteraceae bacterium]|nr:YdeI/OmpD-associated family protein [Hymenobacteraceae bacterium]MDX5395540.1 YdeI/OmpD-associated family protein [Hymenobacteraceae bacterium]MDX5511594.1 YdeI/OmpD-associated family protein [Hymenobacteraceae bacterium]
MHTTSTALPPIYKKLRIRPQLPLLLLNAPADVAPELTTPDTHVAPEAATLYQNAMMFVYNQTDLKQWLPKLLEPTEPDAVLWIVYPKKSGNIKTDLNRDSGWEPVTAAGLATVALVAIDANWSAVRLRPEELVQRVERTPAATITAPADLQQLLEENPQAQQFFSSLSNSCRREYVEWIESAKRPETRTRRITATVERLMAEKKDVR